MDFNSALKLIREIPDFPKPGILFLDITPVLSDASAFSAVISEMIDRRDIGEDTGLRCFAEEPDLCLQHRHIVRWDAPVVTDLGCCEAYRLRIGLASDSARQPCVEFPSRHLVAQENGGSFQKIQKAPTV